MLLIGDVHGKLSDYYQLIKRHKPDQSIQLGDFGFIRQHQWFLSNMDTQKHKILFGNHDYYPWLNKVHSIGANGLSYRQGIGAIRGAYSIDKAARIEGRDWFANEELSYMEWKRTIDAYELHRPALMISHDCPHEVRERLFGITQHSITSDGLQACFELHQPRLWVFGHHHRSVREVINGTQFICLAELETFNL